MDSVIKASSPTSRIYPEALFWRATLAASAADAESDYKHIVVDFPLAPQAEDALLRLAQLELARGDRDAALAHLERIPRDYPRSKSLARASYWAARVFFEKNDIPNACAANANALSQVVVDEVELQNQIQYQGQRCASYNAARVAAANPFTSVASTASSTPSTASASATTASTTPSAAAVPAPQAGQTLPATTNERMTVVDTVKAAKRAPVKAGAQTNNSLGNGYSVQVAAFNKKPEAEKLASSLVKRGYTARVDGEVPPFRVRVGRYSTEKDAEDALRKIKAKHMDGFVTRAPKR